MKTFAVAFQNVFGEGAGFGVGSPTDQELAERGMVRCTFREFVTHLVAAWKRR